MKSLYILVATVLILSTFCILPTTSYAQNISAGANHVLTICVDGTVMAWGSSDYGQLGNGSSNDSEVPVAIPVNLLTGVSSVVAGADHSLVLLNDGSVRSFGGNSYGELGNDSNSDSNVPVEPFELSEIIALAANYHSLALKSDGTIYSFGEGGSGQLGDGTNSDNAYPNQIPSFTGVTAIAAGDYFSLAVKNDGSVWAWGNNLLGQLGVGTNISSNEPLQIESFSNAIAVAGGGSFSLALKGDGTVWSWGRNSSGQLGNGNNTDSNFPVQVSNLTGIIAISAGGRHGVAIKNDGTVWTWGGNLFNQLGNGNANDSNVPVQVSDLTGAVAIDAGVNFTTVALKNDGTVWTWGTGYLGDIEVNNSSVPIQVNGLCEVIASTNDISTPMGSHVFPNPFENTLTVIEKNASGDVFIMDMLGNVVVWQRLSHGNNLINTAHISSGFYWMTVTQGNKKEIIKLVKQ